MNDMVFQTLYHVENLTILFIKAHVEKALAIMLVLALSCRWGVCSCNTSWSYFSTTWGKLWLQDCINVNFSFLLDLSKRFSKQ